MELLTYCLIGALFVLLGITGLMFTYMFYVERLYRERARHNKMLERRNARLRRQLDEADDIITELRAVMADHGIGAEIENEVWADIIEES